MGHADDMFASIKNPGAERAEIEHARQLAFEERIVKALLTFAKVPFHLGDTKRKAKETSGCDTLGFTWFYEQFPGFPIQLAAAKLRNTSGSRIGWTALFGAGFAKLPWFLEYESLAVVNRWDIHRMRCGLVFNAPHANGGATMVLHNQPIQAVISEDPDRRECHETRILRSYGRPPVTYVVEPFQGFLATAGTDWAEDACLL